MPAGQVVHMLDIIIIFIQGFIVVMARLLRVDLYIVSILLYCDHLLMNPHL